MRSLKLIRIGCMAVAVLATGLVIGAQGPGTGFAPHRPPMERAFGAMGEHGKWWNNPELVEKLKLTDEQRKAMDQILLEHRERLIDLHATVEKAELGMEPLMQADQPDESKILAQIDRVAQARADLEKANARFLLALRAKLAPDQWKQLQALKHEHLEHMEHHEMHHPGMRPNSPNTPPPPPPAGAQAPGPQGMMESLPDQDLVPPAEAEPLIAENGAVQ